jgi:hypothetical protein
VRRATGVPTATKHHGRATGQIRRRSNGGGRATPAWASVDGSSMDRLGPRSRLLPPIDVEGLRSDTRMPWRPGPAEVGVPALDVWHRHQPSRGPPHARVLAIGCLLDFARHSLPRAFRRCRVGQCCGSRFRRHRLSDHGSITAKRSSAGSSKAEVTLMGDPADRHDVLDFLFENSTLAGPAVGGLGGTGFAGSSRSYGPRNDAKVRMETETGLRTVRECPRLSPKRRESPRPSA